MGEQSNFGRVAERTAALVQLGEVMAALGSGGTWPGHSVGLGEAEYHALDAAIARAHVQNGWATEENVRHAFGAWGRVLDRTQLLAWTKAYPGLAQQPQPPRTVGLVLAGNIPLVGLHDVLCVWLSGHKARVKCSSQETELVPLLMEVLDHFHPGTRDQVQFTSGKLGDVDAVIATGSNNTARYFEHYFGHLPRIVRRNRVSVAVLDGSETDVELAGLAEDVFRYFGLGCRNVSKVHVPMDFDLDKLFKAFFPWKDIVHHKKYGNNYDYTRALWMLDRIDFLENGFVLLRNETKLASPVAALHYERYEDLASVERALSEEEASIQCIVGHGHVPFGTAQSPGLADYADGADTLAFLLGLK